MFSTPKKKHAVRLDDYNYQRDVENRILLSTLNSFDIEVLSDIMYQPLCYGLARQADSVSSSVEELVESLNKLTQVGLLRIENEQVIVDKDMRRIYETELVKFEEGFCPNIEYITSLLAKVPIDVLPTWYSISRHSDAIIESIIEMYLSTPKKFEQHVLEISFDNPLFGKIASDVFHAPTLKISAEEIRQRYGLNREDFEALMLELEFHFLCFVSYEHQGGDWKEVVTPFAEWRDYLLCCRNRVPNPVENLSKIKKEQHHPFDYILQINEVLEDFDLHGETLDPDMLAVLAGLELVEEIDERYSTTAMKEEWLKKELSEQAMSLFKNLDLYFDSEREEATEKKMRSIERALRPLVNAGWIYFDDFIKGCTEPLDAANPIILCRKGAQWEYVMPEYTDAEKELFRDIICSRFYKSGIVNVGYVGDRLCFEITPFGKAILE